MAKGIRLSEKHGVNATIPKCFYCNEDKNEIILTGRLPDDAEAPKGMVWDKEPCDKCKGHMAKGVIFISVRNEETDHDNPYRTGGWVVLKDEAVARIVRTPALRENILSRRVAFVPDQVWDAIGLPRDAQ